MTTSVARIRLALEADLPGILEISNWAAAHTPANFATEPETLDSWRDDWGQTHERYPWLVAVDSGDGVIGFAKAAPWKGRCAYDWTAEVTVYVHPDHHGQGVAKALYGRLIPTLKAQGYHSLLAGIATPNPASERLHKSFGFRPAARFTRIGWKFGAWHDVAYWEAFLGEGSDPPAAIRGVEEAMRDARCAMRRK